VKYDTDMEYFTQNLGKLIIKNIIGYFTNFLGNNNKDYDELAVEYFTQNLGKLKSLIRIQTPLLIILKHLVKYGGTTEKILEVEEGLSQSTINRYLFLLNMEKIVLVQKSRRSYHGRLFKIYILNKEFLRDTSRSYSDISIAIEDKHIALYRTLDTLRHEYIDENIKEVSFLCFNCKKEFTGYEPPEYCPFCGTDKINIAQKPY